MSFSNDFVLRVTSTATQDLSFYYLVRRTATPTVGFEPAPPLKPLHHAGVKAAMYLTAICDGQLQTISYTSIIHIHIQTFLARGWTFGKIQVR
jgi:hypothetical protein